jgi:hypothetical protein
MTRILQRPIVWVLILAAGLFGLTFLLPDRTAQDPIEHLPWKSSLTQSGAHRALGLVLGQSTLEDAMRLYGHEVKVGVILQADGLQSLEAYFDHIRIAGLSAGMILTLQADSATLEQMQTQSSKQEGTESGNIMFRLSAADQQTSLKTAIKSITYLPKVDLPEEVIEKRFGVPTHRSPAPDNPELTIWEYPEKQLRIIVDAQRKDVIEYY